MRAAYQWAFIRPVRKVYYNLTATGRSVAVALIIGGVELISVLHDKAELSDPVTTWIAEITLDDIGYLIVAVFLLVWAWSGPGPSCTGGSATSNNDGPRSWPTAVHYQAETVDRGTDLHPRPLSSGGRHVLASSRRQGICVTTRAFSLRVLR